MKLPELVGEREHLDEGVRPAVQEHDGGRVWGPRPEMGEVDHLVAGLGAELRISVEPGFLGSPVERVQPIVDEFVQVVGRRTRIPSITWSRGREPGSRESLAQVGEVGVRRVNREWLHCASLI